MGKPRRSILDRSFIYTPSHKTDIRETLERARKAIEAQKEAEAQRKPIPIKRVTQ